MSSRSRWRLWLRRLGVGVLLGCGVGFLLLCWMIDRTGMMDEARPVDAIVILGAQVNPDGSPGGDLEERTQHAVSLYRAGMARYVICTGGEGMGSAARVACARAAELGVPVTATLIAEGSWETRGDAEVGVSVMEEHGWRTALLVTHPLHAFRARLFFRREGVEAYVSPTASSADVPQPWRLWYTLREAGGVVWPYLPFPEGFTRWLQARVYGMEGG